MHPSRRRLAVAASLLALGPVLAGCGDDDGDGDRRSAWPAAAGSVEARGLVWASGSTIHLGDGSTLDAGQPIRSFVVARGGAYVVPDTGSDEQPWPELVRVTPDGAERLGVHPESDSLSPSPDGRHLAFLDRSGERDQYDAPLAEAVVIDLATGDEVFRSSDGMGDPASDDLTDLYEDATPYVLGVDDEHAWVHTVGDIRSIDLATGDVEQVDVADGITAEPWYAALHVSLVAESPDGAWSIRPRPDGQEGAPQLVPAAGSPVTTRLAAEDLGRTPFDPEPDDFSWTLDSWLDTTHAAGIAALSSNGTRTVVLITCAVPDGGCSVVPGSEEPLLPVDRQDDGVLVPEPLDGSTP